MNFYGLTNLIKSLSDHMSTVLMYSLLIGGVLFTLQLGFPQITRIIPAFKRTFGGIFKRKKDKEGSMSSFQALATAIAAQVGTGNIAGVATAIIAGGPGAIFWMWVSAFLGMSTIFAEAMLAQKFRERRNGELVGGPAYYLSKGIKSGFGKFLAGFFALTLIVALGFVGNMVQSNSISSAAAKVLPWIPNYAFGIVIAILAALVFFGGMGRIAKFAELVVPIMAVVYLAGSIVIMVMFRSELGSVLSSIVNHAFTPMAGIGGISGVVVKEAVKKGVARGLFSNEAGMGSTPHAHAVANVKHPVEQGLTAMVGVFIDTVLVCTATAVIILVTRSYELTDASGEFLKGANLTQGAFQVAFGAPGEIFLAICLAFFAFTTIIGWYYFGESNVRYIFGDKAITVYRVIVCVCLVAGAMMQVKLVWIMADFFNSLMVLPNILGLIILSKISTNLLKDYDKKKKLGVISYNYEEE